MPFIQDIHKLPKLQSVTSEGVGRYYNVPNGEWYPSVTTILSAFPAQGLLDWVARVGEEEAEKIRDRAAHRGNIIHGLCENYLQNLPIDSNINPLYMSLFKKFQVELDKNIDIVYGVETPLYSDVMKVAGRTDCIARWKKKPAIIDFKGSDQVKKREWVQGYFEQLSAYSVMFEERTGINIPQVVVILVTDGVPCYYYEGKAKDYIEDFLKKRIDYERIEQKRLVENESRGAASAD